MGCVGPDLRSSGFWLAPVRSLCVVSSDPTRWCVLNQGVWHACVGTGGRWRVAAGILGWIVRAKANTERGSTALNSAPQELLQISQGKAISSLPSISSKETEELEAALARAGISPPPRALPASDYYSILGVPADFSPDELKKAYKKMSRATHPDKNGGSTTRFQAVAAAYEALGDVERKEAYDLGADIKRDIMNDGSEGPSFWDRMRQEYFPEQFGYEPFGDPYEHKVSPHPNP